MSYMKLVFVGNLGSEPEMRYTPSGKAVTNFSVAVNRTYTNSEGQKVKETVWTRVAAWGRQAETCNQYLAKGQKVLIEGRLNHDPETGGPRIWNRQDGSPAASYEITAERVVFLSASGGQNGSGDTEAPAEEISEDEEIPF